MRIKIVLAGAVVATSVGLAAAEECCDRAPPFPKVVYALRPTPFVIPPTGYVLDPSDAAKPFYPVTASPYGSGFGAVPYARRTYSEGGYAYADSYPYTDDPYGHGAASGGGAGTSGYDPPGPGYYEGLFTRPAGAPPYTAYRYRVAPSAKIIHLEPRD
jgi:hypothetical protein